MITPTDRAEAENFLTRLGDIGHIRDLTFLEEDAAALIRRLLAAGSVPDGWRPIETAPKGPVLLLGYFNRCGKWRTLRGRYVSQQEIDGEWMDDFDSCDEGWFEEPVEPDEPPNMWVTTPTHWMQLPAPPLAAAPEAPK